VDCGGTNRYDLKIHWTTYGPCPKPTVSTPRIVGGSAGGGGGGSGGCIGCGGGIGFSYQVEILCPDLL
jgi:hypothetical protein